MNDFHSAVIEDAIPFVIFYLRRFEYGFPQVTDSCVVVTIAEQL